MIIEDDVACYFISYFSLCYSFAGSRSFSVIWIQFTTTGTVLFQKWWNLTIWSNFSVGETISNTHRWLILSFMERGPWEKMKTATEFKVCLFPLHRWICDLSENWERILKFARFQCATGVAVEAEDRRGLVTKSTPNHRRVQLAKSILTAPQDWKFLKICPERKSQ